MSIDPVPSPAPAPAHGESNGHSVDNVENGYAQLKLDASQQVNGQEQDLDLHRACAGGNLDEVRGVLSRGLEGLETLGE